MLQRTMLATALLASAITLSPAMVVGMPLCESVLLSKIREEVLSGVVAALARDDQAWQDELSPAQLQQRLIRLREAVEFVPVYEDTGSDPQAIVELAARKNAVMRLFMDLGLNHGQAGNLVNQLTGSPTLRQKLLTWVAEIEINLNNEGLPKYIVWPTAAFAASWAFTPVSILNTLAISGVIGPWGFFPGTASLEIALVYFSVLYGARVKNLLTSYLYRLYQDQQPADPLETRPLGQLYQQAKPQMIGRVFELIQTIKSETKRQSMQIVMSIALMFGGGYNLDHLYSESLRAYRQHHNIPTETISGD